jgi:tetratricopeptide (TPR) repeat protein
VNTVPNARSPEERFRHLAALYQQGQFQDVVTQGELLLVQFPNVPSILKLLGAANASLDNWAGAASHFRKVVELQPDDSEALSNLAIAFSRLGNVEGAVSSLKSAVQLKPDDAEAHNSLAIALSALGKLDEAIAGFKKTLELAPESAEVHNNLGIAFSRLKRFEEAAASFQRALELEPDYATAHNHLGIALNELGKPHEAITSHEKALALNPDYAAAHNNLGATLNGLGRFADAAASHERALQLKPDFADAHNNLGAAFNQLGKFAEAIESFEAALQLNPSYAEVYNNLGLAYTNAGRLAEAGGNFEKALQLRPDYAEAYYHQSRARRYEHGDPEIRLMLNLLDAPVLSGLDRVYLNFALGNAFEHIGDYDKSFSYFIEGNRLRKEQLESFTSADRAWFEQIERAFSENLHGLEGTETAEDFVIKRPIFIVGMPRSGTTLVEQILASHSQVHGAGELVLLENSISLGDISTGPSVENQFPDVRNKYLSGLAKIDVREDYITDKNPLNFRFIGFILKAIPESKVIHIQRDARAVCWSIFKQFFPRFGIRQSYIYDLSELAEYYKQYFDTMKYWNDYFPNRIYNLNYEVLTKYQDEETRRLLEFIGLDWEEQCLEFYKTERTVQTASSAQVRRQMYQGSSDQWRKYETQLAPMIEALNGY